MVKKAEERAGSATGSVRKERRPLGALVSIVVLLVAALMVMMIARPRGGGDASARIELAAGLYEGAGLEEISAEKYAELVESGENFLVLAHNIACPAGMPLTDLTRQLAAEYGLTIYGLMQAEFRESKLAETISFLPSLAVVSEGKVVAYLDAESDADLPAYQSLEGLKEWLNRYIKL